MRSTKQTFRRRVLNGGMVVALVGATLAVAVNVASATTVAGPQVNPLSDKLQRLLHPDQAQANALADPQFKEPTSGPGSLTSNAPGQIVVEIRVAAINPGQVAAVKAAGADVFFTDGPTHTLTANIAISSLESLSLVPGVQYVSEVLRPMTSSTCEQGIRVSEGDVQVNAANARANKNVSGAGVKVGVLSDSFATRTSPVPTTTAAQDVTNGDLPGATNTCANQQTVSNVVDYTPPTGSSTDEGRGMAQIVHDLAPQSPIDFATAQGGQAVFANNIRNLQAAGAKVIVDDITYFAEPMYQDGVIAQAVQDVTDLGTVYYSSAANNNFTQGGLPVASYEAQNGYRPMTCPATITGHADCHDFDPGAGTSDGDSMTWPASRNVIISLGWNEPQFGITTDYDLYLLNSATNAVIASATANNVTAGTASEVLGGTLGGCPCSVKWTIARKSASAPASTPRFKLNFMANGATAFTGIQWTSANSTDTFGPTTYGHNAKINAGTIAAVPYNNSSVAEAFTSKGPATYCYGPVVGVTPAAPLPSCVTKQIDMAATDGGANTFFGQNVGGGTFRFYGTSAAAPHAAAVAALMLEARPCATPAQIIAAQKSTAAAVGTEAVDTVGSGLINADLAIGALAPCPPIVPAVSPINVSEGNVVTVDFPTATSQPSGHTLTYSLTQNSGPAVSYIQTSSPMQRKFIAPLTTTLPATALQFNLTVSDTTNGTSTTVPVNVTDNNVTPVAVPSAPKIVTAGTTVVLQGASNDAIQPDTAPSGTSGRQYAWSQTGGPSTTLTPGVGAGFRIASFTPATPGTYTFQLVVTDHGGTGAASAPVSVSVEVRAPAAAGTLSGVVKDESGAPISGAAVQVYANTPSGAPVASVVTNGGGAWSVSGLTAGVGYFVNFSKSGFTTRWEFDGFNTAFLRAVNTPNAIVDAVLTTTPRTITGNVTNSSAGAVSGVAVRLVDESGVLDSTTTNGSGGYSFSGLTPKSTYRIQLAPSDPTFATAWVTSDGRGATTGASGQSILLIDTTGGNAVAATTVVFNKVTEVRTFTATVKTAGNVPITGAEVRLYNPGWVASQRTNAAGVYVITGLRPGNTYQAWVWTKCAGCTSGAFTSQWAVGIPGEQYDQTGKLAGTVDITNNQALVFTLT